MTADLVGRVVVVEHGVVEGDLDNMPLNNNTNNNNNNNNILVIAPGERWSIDKIIVFSYLRNLGTRPHNN